MGKSNESASINKMGINEFVQEGILQEVNRRLLHPMGLALEVTVESDGSMSLSGIWDYRDNPEGIIYNWTSDDDSERREAKAKNVERMLMEKEVFRQEQFGWTLQPLDGTTKQ